MIKFESCFGKVFAQSITIKHTLMFIDVECCRCGHIHYTVCWDILPSSSSAKNKKKKDTKVLWLVHSFFKESFFANFEVNWCLFDFDMFWLRKVLSRECGLRKIKCSFYFDALLPSISVQQTVIRAETDKGINSSCWFLGV